MQPSRIVQVPIPAIQRLQAGDGRRAGHPDVDGRLGVSEGRYEIRAQESLRRQQGNPGSLDEAIHRDLHGLTGKHSPNQHPQAPFRARHRDMVPFEVEDRCLAANPHQTSATQDQPAFAVQGEDHAGRSTAKDDTPFAGGRRRRGLESLDPALDREGLQIELIVPQTQQHSRAFRPQAHCPANSPRLEGDPVRRDGCRRANNTCLPIIQRMPEHKAGRKGDAFSQRWRPETQESQHQEAKPSTKACKAVACVMEVAGHDRYGSNYRRWDKAVQRSLAKCQTKRTATLHVSVLETSGPLVAPGTGFIGASRHNPVREPERSGQVLTSSLPWKGGGVQMRPGLTPGIPAGTPRPAA